MRYQWTLLAGAILVSALQQGCSGGGGDAGVIGGSGQPPDTFPTLNADVYRGFAAVGELIELTLDPVAKTYSLVVVSSQFGVPSTPVTGSYRVDASGRFVDTLDPGIVFVVSNGQAYGNFKVRTGSGAPLNVALMATNQSTTSVKDLVGTYSFAQRTAALNGSDAQAEAGQLMIGADGSVRLCEAQAFFDTCKSLDGQDAVAQLVHVGNGRWNITSGSVKLADLYPRRTAGVTSFLIDYAFSDNTGPRVGSGIVVGSRNLESGAFDGTYDCFTSGVIVSLTITGANAIDDSGNAYLLTYNHGGSLFNSTWRTFDAGSLIESALVGFAAPNGRFNLLPLNTKELVGTGVNGSGTVLTFSCIRP